MQYGCVVCNKMKKSIRSPGNAFVEGDASSASYFLAGAAVTGGTVTVEGCGTSSLQVFHRDQDILFTSGYFPTVCMISDWYNL